MTKDVDLLVVGGGLNGTAIARDAAGRGLSVYLAEAVDWGAAMSSSTCKFSSATVGLSPSQESEKIQTLLKDNENLIQSSPHLCLPLRVVLLEKTAHKGKGGWFKNIFQNKSQSAKKTDHSAFPLEIKKKESAQHFPHLKMGQGHSLKIGFECSLDDSRLALENAINARAKGADIGNNRHVRKILPDEGLFRAEIMTAMGPEFVRAPFVVNAAGARAKTVSKIFQGFDTGFECPEIQMARIGQIMLPMVEPVLEDAFILPNPKGKFVYVTPWLHNTHLLVTTFLGKSDGETSVGDCGEADQTLMLSVLNQFLSFQAPERDLQLDDVIWHRTMPAISMDAPEACITFNPQGKGGVLTVLGGQAEHHMGIAERCLTQLQQAGLAMGPAWTAETHNHGGGMDLDALMALAKEPNERVEEPIRWRWIQTYGARAQNLLEMVQAVKFLARDIAPGVPEAELLYSVEVEDANTAEDFLYRRTKLGLTLEEDGISAISAWFAKVEEKAHEMRALQQNA